MDWNTREGHCWRSRADLRGSVVAGTYGPYFEGFEAGTAYRANACSGYRTKGDDDRKKVGVILMSWLRHIFGPSNADRKYDEAMRLSAEVIAAMRDKKRSSDPFKALVGDMFFQSHPSIETIVSVYEMHQEGQIWKGPPR
jgi:hypothetical protein